MGESAGSEHDQLKHRRPAGTEPSVDESRQHIRGARKASKNRLPPARPYRSLPPHPRIPGRARCRCRPGLETGTEQGDLFGAGQRDRIHGARRLSGKLAYSGESDHRFHSEPISSGSEATRVSHCRAFGAGRARNGTAGAIGCGRLADLSISRRSRGAGFSAFRRPRWDPTHRRPSYR